MEKEINYWHPGISCVNDDWEQAYLRFETPEEEINKFLFRLRKMGATQWSKDAHVVELFCGRGNGLVAFERLGFKQLSGVDLSPDLLKCYQGPASLYCADCREMQFEDGSIDIAIIQGGLHHLEAFPGDVESTLKEIRRVLKPGTGIFVNVEPWLTPFLSFAHFTFKQNWLRKLWPKLDACARMTELEYPIYDRWIDSPEMILALFAQYFEIELSEQLRGKHYFIGRKQ